MLDDRIQKQECISAHHDVQINQLKDRLDNMSTKVTYEVKQVHDAINTAHLTVGNIEHKLMGNLSPYQAHVLFKDLVEKDKIFKEVEEEKALAEKQKQNAKLRERIQDVIFSNPCTIVFWKDGSKTVVKKQKGDKWNKETGLAMAMAKKFYQNTNIFNDELRKWCE